MGVVVMSMSASCLNWWYMSYLMMCFEASGSFSLIHEMSRNPPCGFPPFADLAQDASRHVIPGQQFGGRRAVLSPWV